MRDGELVTPVMRGYKMQCCDCRLVHRITFAIVGGSVTFRPTRDNRATAAARRHRKTGVRS